MVGPAWHRLSIKHERDQQDISIPLSRRWFDLHGIFKKFSAHTVLLWLKVSVGQQEKVLITDNLTTVARENKLPLRTLRVLVGFPQLIWFTGATHGRSLQSQQTQRGAELLLLSGSDRTKGFIIYHAVQYTTCQKTDNRLLHDSPNNKSELALTMSVVPVLLSGNKTEAAPLHATPPWRRQEPKRNQYRLLPVTGVSLLSLTVACVVSRQFSAMNSYSSFATR